MLMRGATFLNRLINAIRTLFSAAFECTCTDNQFFQFRQTERYHQAVQNCQPSCIFMKLQLLIIRLRRLASLVTRALIASDGTM